MKYGDWIKSITPRLINKLNMWQEGGEHRSYTISDSKLGSVIWIYDGSTNCGMYVDSSNEAADWDKVLSNGGGYSVA